MITVYHNTRCSKSRSACQLLTDGDTEFHIIEYLKTPLSESDISALLKKLQIPAEALVRKQEELYKAQFKDKKYSEKEWISILAKHPVLIERPIVVKGDKALIARPPELALTLL